MLPDGDSRRDPLIRAVPFWAPPRFPGLEASFGGSGHMTHKRRLEQVNELLREEIASLLILENTDPVLAAMTVTEVRVTPDLSFARVFVMIRRGAAGEVSEAESPAGLQHAAEKVQKLLGGRIHIKRTPRLRFEVDDTAERAERIEQLLNEVRDDWDHA